MQFFAPIEVREENRMSFDSSSPRFSVQLTKRDEHLLNRTVEDQHELAKLLGRFREGCVPFFLPSAWHIRWEHAEWEAIPPLQW
jgi:hypothetical protein